MSATRFWVQADDAPPTATEAMGAMQELRTPSRMAFAESREFPAAERRLMT